MRSASLGLLLSLVVCAPVEARSAAPDVAAVSGGGELRAFPGKRPVASDLAPRGAGWRTHEADAEVASEPPRSNASRAQAQLVAARNANASGDESAIAPAPPRSTASVDERVEANERLAPRVEREQTRRAAARDEHAWRTVSARGLTMTAQLAATGDVEPHEARDDDSAIAPAPPRSIASVDERDAANELRAPPADDYERVLAKARLAAAEGRYDDAAAVLEAAAATWPQDFVLRLELAWARLRARRSLEAEAAYRAALELNADSYEARWGLADALLAQQRWAAARDAFDAMLTQRPGDFEARLGLARVLAGQRQWDAVRDATGALLLEKDDARVHTLQGLAHFWLGELREARAHYERALALTPDDEDARLGLAWVAQRRGHRSDARAGFESVLADQPGTALGRAGALEGLTALGPAHEVLLHGHALVQAASGHPVRTTEYGVVVGGDARLGDAWLLGARYRRIGRLDLTRSNAPGFSNDEGWLRLGVDRGAWGVALYGAGVVFTPGAGSTALITEDGWMAGASAHVRAWADWRAAVTASVYPSGVIGQGELGAGLPLGRWVTLSVAARGQWAHGVPRVAGLGLVEVHGERWALAAGGGYGAQTHPVELDALALYNLTDEQRWRATARGQVRVGRYVVLFASGDAEAWRTLTTSGAVDSVLFRGVLGFGLTFPGG